MEVRPKSLRSYKFCAVPESLLAVRRAISTLHLSGPNCEIVRRQGASDTFSGGPWPAGKEKGMFNTRSEAQQESRPCFERESLSPNTNVRGEEDGFGIAVKQLSKS
jgi:hypothetical protein